MWTLSPLTGGCVGSSEEIDPPVVGDNPFVLPDEPPKPQWKSVTDKSTGQVYYYHRITKQTSWTKPDKFDEERKAYKQWKKRQQQINEAEDQSFTTTMAVLPPAPFDEVEQQQQKGGSGGPASQQPLASATTAEKVTPASASKILASDTAAAVATVEQAPDLDEGSIAVSSGRSGLKPKEEQEVVIAPLMPEDEEANKQNKDDSQQLNYSATHHWDKRPKPQAVVFPTPPRKKSPKAATSSEDLPSEQLLSLDKKVRSKSLDRTSAAAKREQRVMYHTLPKTTNKKDKRRRRNRRSLSPDALRSSKHSAVSPSSPVDSLLDHDDDPKPSTTPTDPPAPRYYKSKKKLLTAKIPVRSKKEKPTTEPLVLAEDKTDRYAVAVPPPPQKLKRSLSARERIQAGIPKKVQIPFFRNKSLQKCGSKSWNACQDDNVVADDDMDDDEVVSDGTLSTLSRSSNDSLESENGDSPQEDAATWETICSRQIWNMCSMIDPCEDAWVCHRPQDQEQ